MSALTIKLWRQDVLNNLVFQWLLLFCLSLLLWLYSFSAALNVLLAGAAIVIPSTALGAWMGLKLMMGGVNPIGVLVGSLLKTTLSVGLLAAVLLVLQDSPNMGLNWLGFLVGVMGMAMAPALYGLVHSLSKK